MISDFIGQTGIRVQGSGISELRARKAQSFDSQVHIINGFVGGEDGGAEGGEGHADEVYAGEDEGGFAVGGDADQAAAAVKAGGR